MGGSNIHVASLSWNVYGSTSIMPMVPIPRNNAHRAMIGAPDVFNQLSCKSPYDCDVNSVKIIYNV
jgi:hypothetical protein